jgi:cell division protein FtsI (penicillin-binding protein 3)
LTTSVEPVTAPSHGLPNRWTRLRIGLLGLVIIGALGGVLVRAAHLQVVQSAHLRSLAEEQHLREIQIPAHRGTIVDRTGIPLAVSVDIDSIWADPQQVGAGAAWDVAVRLSRPLSMAPAELARRLRGRRHFVWLKRRVPPELARVVQHLAIPGIYLAKEPKRFYPNRQLAGTVLGFANSDGDGIEGVELSLDHWLRGGARSVAGLRDALGRTVMTQGVPQESRATAGHDVVLTLDRAVQYAADRAVATAQESTRAAAISIVALEPKSGELLAIANSPSLDPNSPSAVGAGSEKGGDKGVRNRAVTDPYEPGSVMKVFTMAAALESRRVRPEDRFFCENGTYAIGRRAIHDSHPHGWLTASQIIQMSSNIGIYKVACRVGRQALADTLRRFGFGRPTGIEVPGERSGIIRSDDQWGQVGFANVSFGHGITVTPIQLAAAYGAIANGGVWVPPRLVKSIRDVRGAEVAMPRVAPRRVISQEAAAELTAMMRKVVELEGTAKAAQVEGYAVAGKTGTAQKVDVVSGRYSSDRYVATFAGFLPADVPRLVVVVRIDDPVGEHRAGAVAAPIFRQVAEETMRYLGVPAASDALAQARPPKASSAVAAAPPPAAGSAKLHAASIDADDSTPLDPRPAHPEELLAVLGPAGSKADRRLEKAGRGASEGGRGDADAGWVQVPDFRGMSMGEALEAARRAGLRVVLRGSGRVVGQSPEPGHARGTTICTIRLDPSG